MLLPSVAFWISFGGLYFSEMKRTWNSKFLSISRHKMYCPKFQYRNFRNDWSGYVLTDMNGFLGWLKYWAEVFCLERKFPVLNILHVLDSRLYATWCARGPFFPFNVALSHVLQEANNRSLHRWYTWPISRYKLSKIVESGFCLISLWCSHMYIHTTGNVIIPKHRSKDILHFTLYFPDIFCIDIVQACILHAE